MIQVLGKTISPSEFEIVTTEKVGGKIQHAVVRSPAELHRLYYFLVRNYVFERFTAFFIQRIKAFQAAGAGFKNYEVTASRLLKTLRDRQHSTRESIYSFILANEDTIHAIAPGERSGQFKYYQNTIRSIIQFCKDPEGDFVI